MVMKKACCCLSLGTGSLVILCYCLVDSVWSMLSLLTTIGDPMYKEFLRGNDYLFYTHMVITSIGSLIFLATILSITSNSSSKSLLTVVIAFLLLNEIYSFYATYLFTSNGVFEKIYYTEMENQARKLPEHFQDEFRTNMEESYPAILSGIYVGLVVNALFVLYFVLVLRSYLIEMNGNHVGNVPTQMKVKDGPNFSAPSFNNVQFISPRHHIQPPRYSIQASPAPPYWAQPEVNKNVYPTLHQLV